MYNEEVFEEIEELDNMEEDFPEKDKSKAKERKADVRAKHKKEHIKEIDELRDPKSKKIRCAKEDAKRKEEKRSNRQSVRIALNELTK